MKTRRAYLKAPRHFEIEEQELTLHDDEVLVKIKLCGLCNWELNFWQGTGGPDSYYNTYKGVLGHEWAGTVKEVGTKVTTLKKGDKVTYLPGDEFGGFSEYSVFKERECYRVGDDVDLDNAMGEPLKCIVTVLRNVAAEVGDFGVMQGCGPMGLWCIQALRSAMLGGLIAVDVDDAKLALAKKYGATHTVNPTRVSAMEAVAEITGGAMCDFAIEGTGSSALILTCADLLTARGRLVLMSSYAKSVADFDLTQIMDKGIRIFPAHPSSSRDVDDDMQRAARLITRGTFHNEDIISHRFRLEEIDRAFETLEHKPKDYIKGIVEIY